MQGEMDDFIQNYERELNDKKEKEMLKERSIVKRMTRKDVIDAA